ncbi:MAG: zinc-binding protein [Deltaproteobacteria bacterium]|nr:zinc-binding protein [Deltaproteobacteria bacterium]
MNIIELLPGLKRIAGTGGGEWAGPCPRCGGRDRLRLWPEKGTTGRFWCRSCGWSGDGLQMIRDLKGLTFPEALKAWGLPTNGPRDNRSGGAAGTVRTVARPGDIWMDQAKVFLERCQRDLWNSSGADGRTLLLDRGLKTETVKLAGLGWNAYDRYQSRENWGLKPEKKEDGKPRRIWLPGGLVIPGFDQARIIRLKIRRSSPGEGSRYVFVAGSSSLPMSWGLNIKIIVLVESELDGLLLAQEAGDLVGVIAMGSAQIRPDQKTDKVLRKADLILVSLDSDQAGGREAWGFWKKNYQNARRWPVPFGKDQTEAAQKGLDLRAWVMAGLPAK